MNGIRFCFITIFASLLILISGCSQTNEETGPPPCDMSEINQLSDNIKQFVFGSKKASFNDDDWITNAISHLLTKYKTIKERNLFGMLKIRGELKDLEGNLQNLLKLSKQHEQRVQSFACLASDEELNHAASDSQAVARLLSTIKDLNKLFNP